jgi:hypothetical protein
VAIGNSGRASRGWIRNGGTTRSRRGAANGHGGASVSGEI